jgi:ribulose-5-phosphate 4-epimerase/fuculose-1-phosphate aldolase
MTNARERSPARGWSEEEARHRRAICEIGKLCYSRNYIVGADGNISVRMSDGTILITPAGAMKGFLEPAAPRAHRHEGQRSTAAEGSTEAGIHLVVYESAAR